jgi:hypothetical protein
LCIAEHPAPDFVEDDREDNKTFFWKKKEKKRKKCVDKLYFELKKRRYAWNFRPNLHYQMLQSVGSERKKQQGGCSIQIESSKSSP